MKNRLFLNESNENGSVPSEPGRVKRGRGRPRKNPEPVVAEEPAIPDKTCLIPDCGEKAVARGLCHTCVSWEIYHLNRYHGVEYFTKWNYRYKRLHNRTATMLARSGHGIAPLAPKLKNRRKRAVRT